MSTFRLHSNEPSQLDIDWSNQTIAFVYTHYHSDLNQKMLDAGIAYLRSQDQACANRVVLVAAPGAFELPWVTQQMLAHKKQVTGVVTLGAVIRGGTPHFEYVSQAVSNGILQVSLTHKVPITFGVLTVDTMEQAQERVVDGNNKGKEATVALVALLALHASLKAHSGAS